MCTSLIHPKLPTIFYNNNNNNKANHLLCKKN
uniref:Uncharacterized protein n=1 Tax=Arundo donax TaxID=35708 RepID=A0A0A9DAU8_ARUDO